MKSNWPLRSQGSNAHCSAAQSLCSESFQGSLRTAASKHNRRNTRSVARIRRVRLNCWLRQFSHGAAWFRHSWYCANSPSSSPAAESIGPGYVFRNRKFHPPTARAAQPRTRQLARALFWRMDGEKNSCDEPAPKGFLIGFIVTIAKVATRYCGKNRRKPWLTC